MRFHRFYCPAGSALNRDDTDELRDGSPTWSLSRKTKPPTDRVVVSEEDCIRTLKEAAETLGESPTKAQYEAQQFTPSSTTVVRIFGSWNRAKEVAGLETYSQREGGGVPIQSKPDRVDLPNGIVWEELNPQQRWYYKNRERRIAMKSRRKNELRRWFHDLKRDELSCDRCEEDHPACLEFHHVGPKERGVAEMVKLGHSRMSIEEEMEQCVVLCANCHRKRHYEVPTDAE